MSSFGILLSYKVHHPTASGSQSPFLWEKSSIKGIPNSFMVQVLVKSPELEWIWWVPMGSQCQFESQFQTSQGTQFLRVLGSWKPAECWRSMGWRCFSIIFFGAGSQPEVSWHVMAPYGSHDYVTLTCQYMVTSSSLNGYIISHIYPHLTAKISQES